MFDWLNKSILEFIIGVYKQIYSLNDLYATAVLSPANFNKDIWNSVNSFSNNVVLPIAWSLLSLFLLIELAEIFNRSDTKGMESIYFVILVLLKIMLAKLVMENATLIINAIFEISSFLVSKANFITSTEFKVSTTEFADMFSNKSTLSLLGIFIESQILNLITMVCKQIAKIIIILRFIEIYVFSAVSSLAFSTFPSKEYSSIFKGFIKRMVALSLHVVFIIVVLYIYMVLLKTSSPTANGGDVMQTLYTGAGYSILLVIALFQTGSWAKSAAQA